MPNHRNQYHLYLSILTFIKGNFIMPARIQSTKGHDLYKFNVALKQNLKNAIYVKGSSIREVAEHLGINQVVLSSVLSENRRTYVLCIDFAYLICKFLGITLADVIPMSEESRSLVMHKTVDGERVKELEHKLDLIRSVLGTEN
jgi:hypothetical protein|nr:MAG TPA: antitoxin [Bacteriophage sp.]